MLIKRTDSELWQKARDVLASSGMAAKDVDRVLVGQPQPHLANDTPDPQQQSIGEEAFAPVTAPRMHRDILPGSVPLIPFGGMTWLQEVASEPQGAVASWAGDLESAHIAATEALELLLDTHYGREHLLFDVESQWPSVISDAEQFYSLRDSINFVEQWLPGDCLQYPGLVGVVGVLTASDECLIFAKDLPQTRFLGITMAQWEVRVRSEVRARGGYSAWLDLAFSALYSCICLQSLEKAMLSGVEGVKIATMELHTLQGYFTRCEVGQTAASNFFVLAYSGAPYRVQDVRPLCVAAAGDAVILDLAKRASGRGGGSVTEVGLGGDGGIEIRMRAHLIGRIFSYACDNLPPSLTIASYRFWEAAGVMPLLNDRYVERGARRRAVVPEAFLKKMDDILRVTGGFLRTPTTGSTGKPLAGESLHKNDAAEVAGWQPSSEGECPSTASTDGVVFKAATPALWLKALSFERPRGDTPDKQGQASLTKTTNGDDESQGFVSMLRLVPTVGTSAAQKLETVFDGNAYLGRPVGSCQA
jgi:hypothetical protein